MFIKRSYPWRVGIKKAIEIQERLKRRIVIKRNPVVRKVAGVDVGYSSNKLTVAVCVFSRLRGTPIMPGSDLDHSKICVICGSNLDI